MLGAKALVEKALRWQLATGGFLWATLGMSMATFR